MSDFKSRLLEEKAQLDERLSKIESFQQGAGFSSIPIVQQTLLNIQQKAMATYSQILAERIALIENSGASPA